MRFFYTPGARCPGRLLRNTCSEISLTRL
uniref:Uncharacterized protein n=1 Tax=Anguilla anguilla TaxID=7936 RepID=A0A0E9RXR5_ANGAN